MKYLILILLTISFNSLANDKCKQVGELAKEIMIKRQSQEDVFKLLPLYKDQQDMVFAAYEEPHHDILSQLMIAVNASVRKHEADEVRKYDDMEAKFKNTVNRFKLKYIKLCIQSK
jgi:hypothetical protein